MSYFIQGISDTSSTVYLTQSAEGAFTLSENFDNKRVFQELREAFLTRDSLATFDIANLYLEVVEI